MSKTSVELKQGIKAHFIKTDLYKTDLTCIIVTIPLKRDTVTKNALVPFMISILSNLKVDKVTGVAATFGGIMIGLLGSTYSNVSAVFVNAQVNNGKGLGLGYANELMGTLILFAIAYILLTYLTFARMNAVSKKKDVAFLDDPFVTVVEEKTSKKNRVFFFLPINSFIICVCLGTCSCITPQCE